MIERRALLTSLVAGGAVVALGGATPTADLATPGVRQVFVHDLPPTALDGWMVTGLEVTLAPGAAAPPHRHAGFVLGTVLAGTMRFQVGDDAVTTLRAGDCFYEPPASVHRVAANASATAPVRFLALVLAPRGSALTVAAE